MEPQETMEKLNELLPGIEEFLVKILRQEKLSTVAEERRQYFAERLDILRLPPSLPPRFGKRLSTELLQESEESFGIPSEQIPGLNGCVGLEAIADALADRKEEETVVPELTEDEKDFAAKQREISRNLLASVSSEKDLIEGSEESDSAKGIKVYDDIDPSESIRPDDEDDDDDDINALYEIPVARQPLPQPTSEDSLSQPADVSSLATANSADDISDDVLDSPSPSVWQPPPLPPRITKKNSDSSDNRASSNSLDGKALPPPPGLPFRPPLPRRNDAYARSEKSDKSEKSEKSDMSDGDSTSYESCDENEHDSDLLSKLNIKLPKRPKKKSRTGSRLLSSKARSSSTWEINVPFRKLENVVISGEMQHKGKLSWNRRQVAISNGCMAMYKPDKETRPVFVIPLSGFSAWLGDPLGRKGFEMRMSHENGESYVFAVDFKEWVNLWCEHINGISQGLSVPVYHQHLARTFSAGSENSTYGSKADLRLDEGDYEIYEEYSTDTNSVFGSPPLTPRPARFDHTPPASSSGLRSPASTSRLTARSRTPSLPHNRSLSSLGASGKTASSLTLSRLDWKTLFYDWAFPLDQVIVNWRRRDGEGNLSNSNSNLSVSSDGVESDDSSKPRLRVNKVMRMGSFAYRATQFFENLTIGKKTGNKRKTSSLSSPTEADFNLRDGIQEESSLSSSSLGLPATSPSSDMLSPDFEDSFRQSSVFSSPTSPEPPPLPSTPPPCIPVNVKHQGYLNIFSSFNKRRWGQRWCMIRANMFECYKTQTSHPCELNFLLKNCVLRQALAETNSPLAIMLLENNKEKITVEPPNKEQLSQWLRVLMVETSTQDVPTGLEEFFTEGDDNSTEDLRAVLEAEYTDIVGVGVLKSWEIGSVPILLSHEKKGGEDAVQKETTEAAIPEVQEDDSSSDSEEESADSLDQPVPDKYLYSEVIKRPSSASLKKLEEEEEEEGAKDEEYGDGAQGAEGEGQEQEIPRFTDNLAVYNANKNTTDSGFYSVKEATSDSESGSEVKTDQLSPSQEGSPPLDVQGEATPTKCNNPDTASAADSASVTGTVQPSEEDDDESVLEKTMTSDDFKDSLEPERNSACVDGVQTRGESVELDNHSCENGPDEKADHKDVVSQVSAEKDSVAASVPSTDNHVRSDKTDSQAAVGEESQPREKAKKKRKKSKNKKGKQKQQESEHGPPSESHKVSNSKSQKSSFESDNSDKPRIPRSSVSKSEHSASDAVVSSEHSNAGKGQRETDNAIHQPTTSKANSEAADADKGLEEDEVVTELKERIGKLREKLVQIKRKRIAVRDKRVRAFSPEERAVCDKEYLALESECKATASTIQSLEEQLKKASAPTSYTF